MTAKYICFEGTEGVGKTTQTQKLVDFLRAKGFKVLQTKEPGTAHSPLTMELRNIMLNAKYEPEMSAPARELVSQAIRSIHLEKVVQPALEQYDFIIQDRGILSGLAYGKACGNDIDWLTQLVLNVVPKSMYREFPTTIYDTVILLQGNVADGLAKAQAAKQEFEAGDAIEMRGVSFMDQTNSNMEEYSAWFNTAKINVNGKSIDEVFNNILSALAMETTNEQK